MRVGILCAAEGARLHVDVGLVVSIATVALEIVSLSFIPLVLLRKKEASSTAAWILLLVFVPLAGVVLFWFLGRDRVRYPARRKRAMNALVRGRLSLPSVADSDAIDAMLAGQPEAQRGVMRLASMLARKGIVRGNAVEVLVGGPATYDAIVHAIHDAKASVHVEFYILRPDATGRRLLDALTRAAQRGVRVRLVYDSFGSSRLRRHLGPLVAAGGEVAAFLPLDPIRRAWTINLRNHRKLVVVDGEVGFTGGINVGDEFAPWRDVFLCVRGPAVWELQAIFAEDWAFAKGSDLPDPALASLSVALRGESIVQFVGSGPDATNEIIHKLYFAAIASARERVWITTPYFVPDRALLAALETAALRGVDVRIIVPRKSNHRVTFHAGRSFYDELLSAGVHVHEYLPQMLHTKTMIVDGVLATVGSANLDTRSFRLNFEVIAVVYDRDVVHVLERVFQEDQAQTEEVSLAAWVRRPLTQRLREGWGRLLAPLL